MAPKLSLTRKQSLIRRSLALLGTALLATAWLVGTSTPASAAAPRALQIVSATTDGDLCPTADRCAILAAPQEFEVLVRVVDRNGQPATVSRDTTVVLEKLSGEGSLDPDGSQVTILKGGSEAKFENLTYSQSANPVLRVRVTSGVQLNSDEITVPIAITAVRGNADRGTQLDLDDPNCGAGNGVPTSTEPTDAGSAPGCFPSSLRKPGACAARFEVGFWLSRHVECRRFPRGSSIGRSPVTNRSPHRAHGTTALI